MEGDPWLSDETKTEIIDTKEFEDDFVNKNRTFGSLPDSAEYIANLEKKLEKVKKGSGTTKKEILNSLEEKRKDCMVRLLVEDFEQDPEDLLDEDIPTKWLKSHINPQQPLTVSEVVELVKADYLAKASEEDFLTQAQGEN